MNSHKKYYFSILTIFLICILVLIPIKALSSSPTVDLVKTLQQVTDGTARISYHAETGKVRFIGTDPSHPIPQSGEILDSTTAVEAARLFLGTYGKLFGINDPTKELTVMSEEADEQGRSFVRFQQVYQTSSSPAIRVMGGELMVQMNNYKQVTSANGEILPDISLNPVPTVDPATAQQTALATIAKSYGISTEELTTTNPELWIYNPVLLGGRGLRLNTLVWRMDVTDREAVRIKELVLVDAQLGVVALHFNEIDTAKYRKIYDNQNNDTLGLPGPNLIRIEGQPASGNGDVDKAYDYAGITYDFYKNIHNRDSLNGAGMQLISTVRYCEAGYACPYQNAYWSGTQMVYGQGYASAADVVGHEMTHGVTDFTSKLFYQMQSGAVNEALSDIWGEFIERTYVNPNDNWDLGEALPGGAIRSLSNPPAYGQPDRMTSGYYYCGEDDGGGVHTNSGVGNKAAYLMAAGGTFNGKTITPLRNGMAEVAKIFYEVQTHMLTSASDYADLYDGLIQACTNLIGSGVTTSADCLQVQNALLAVEMNKQPTNCPAPEAPVCPTGKTANNIFYDNLENTSSGNWAHSANTGYDEWYYPQNTHPYTGFDATYATSGRYNFWGYDVEATSDYYIALTKNIALPAGSFLHFNHAYAFEAGNYDGGVLEYSTNSGSTWTDTGALIINNGYDGQIATGSGNPLGGRQGFVGLSNGYISSRLDLSSLAGQNVRFRFRIGTDVAGWGYGWFIDDIQIYTCSDAQRGLLPLVLRGKGTPTPTPKGQKSPTPTRTPTTPPQLPTTFTAVADSFIAEGSPGDNYGADTNMFAGYDEYYSPSLQIVRSLLKFDLSAIPFNTVINNAILKVYYAGYFDYPDQSRTITSYRIGSNWSESSVTWNNRPSLGEAFGSTYISANNSWRYVTLDVTGLVQGWLNGSYPNYGIMLRGPEESGADSAWRQFLTRHAEHVPQLVITYAGGGAIEMTPEPPAESINPTDMPGGEMICVSQLDVIKCFEHR